MADYSDFVTAVRAVQNKGCPAGALMQIAAAQPNLRPMIAAHPNADAPLLDWLDAQGDVYVQAAVKARRANDAGQPLDKPAAPGGVARGVVAAIAVGALVIGAAIGSLVTHQVMASPSSPSGNPGASAPATPLPSGQTIPPDGNSTNLAQAAWITVPNTPKSGALIVDVHFDYQCPYCGILEKTYDTMFQQLVQSGDIELRLHTRTFLDRLTSNQSSTLAATAAACVDVAAPTLYLAYHNTVFNNQPSEGTGYTDDQLRNTFAADAGLTGTALSNFQACYDSKATSSWVSAVETNNGGTTLNQSPPNKFLFGGNDPLYYDPSSGQMVSPTAGGTQAGVQGTPAIFVNGNMMSWGQMFSVDSTTNAWTPTITSSTALLQMLQQATGTS